MTAVSACSQAARYPVAFVPISAIIPPFSKVAAVPARIDHRVVPELGVPVARPCKGDDSALACHFISRHEKLWSSWPSISRSNTCSLNSSGSSLWQVIRYVLSLDLPAGLPVHSDEACIIECLLANGCRRYITRGGPFLTPKLDLRHCADSFGLYPTISHTVAQPPVLVNGSSRPSQGNRTKPGAMRRVPALTVETGATKPRSRPSPGALPDNVGPGTNYQLVEIPANYETNSRNETKMTHPEGIPEQLLPATKARTLRGVTSSYGPSGHTPAKYQTDQWFERRSRGRCGGCLNQVQDDTKTELLRSPGCTHSTHAGQMQTMPCLAGRLCHPCSGNSKDFMPRIVSPCRSRRIGCAARFGKRVSRNNGEGLSFPPHSGGCGSHED